MRERQRRALDSIQHRGPDDSSEYLDEGIWLGFQRLSILDLSPSGRQPMSFGNGRYTLVFNGEIYNFKELYEQIGSPALSSSGDSVVLGTMLARMPVEEVLSRLRGMYAFAWWDSVTRELLVVRDPFGIKPLYHCEMPGGGLIFGSELRAVSKLSGGDREVSRSALSQYFRWGAVQAAETIFEGIRCLPPGCLLRWKDGVTRVVRYSTLSFPGREEWVEDPAEQRALTRETLLASVKAHLIADVPVGVFLSGGLDSTLLAASMKELGCDKFKAFSIGYEENAGVPDETDAAEQTARFLGCEFVRERLTPTSLLESLDPYFASLDQPSGDALNTWLVSRVAAQHLKVTLSGLGADEWFAGYNGMRLVHLASKVRAMTGPLTTMTGPLMKMLNNALPASIRNKPAWKAAFYGGGGAGSKPAEWHAMSRSIIDEGEVAALLDLSPGDVRAATLEFPELKELLETLVERAPDSHLNQLLLMETHTYLANTLLRDNDSTSMAHSLELRVPLVDREVFKLAGRMPPGSKLDLHGGKRILRDSMADLLPDWILEDRRKKTFTLPLMKWMRGPGWRERIHDVLGSQAFRERGWVDPVVGGRILKRYEEAGNDTKTGWKISQAVWMIFVLESWAALNT